MRRADNIFDSSLTHSRRIDQPRLPQSLRMAVSRIIDVIGHRNGADEGITMLSLGRPAVIEINSQ